LSVGTRIEVLLRKLKFEFRMDELITDDVSIWRAFEMLPELELELK
jgi:hypothetical protein